jgi:nucleotide-binding universal stress UspA family protein
MSDDQVSQADRTEAEGRTFLCVLDESAELHVALKFAALRAERTGGRVALLYVIEPADDFQHWASIGNLMREEAREEAQQVLQRMASQINQWCGSMPMLYVREGARGDEVLKLVNEEPSISVLVLGADTGPKGPGPLVTELTGKMVGRLRVPVTIVPGNLSDEDIDEIV